MSAPQLTISEQKATLTGKKKKKQTLKNVLTIPKNMIVETHTPEVSESEKLKTTLERLLPNARLSIGESNETLKDEGALLKGEAKRKRNQLILGVNALTRSIKKELVAGVLLASDIQPKFLVHHLNLLCGNTKIPLLHINGLREITKSCLGFVCIALGFKKNSSDFFEVVKEIQTLAQTKSTDSNEDRKVASDTSDNSESSDEENIKDLSENDKPFTYLYRTSNNTRIFIPEKSLNDQSKEEPEDFIKVKNCKDEIPFKNKTSTLEVLSRLKNKKKNFKSLDNSENTDSDDEDLEIPKKKAKRKWVIDKAGTKQSIKYFQANLIKVFSNPDRNKKK